MSLKLLIKRIYGRLLDSYDKITSTYHTVNIGDIMGPRGSIGETQFLSASRLLDIEAYYNGDERFYYQNLISGATYGKKHKPEIGNKHFVELIKSYENMGFNADSFFTVDKKLVLSDGNHRTGMNLYFGYNTIKIRLLHRKKRISDNYNWFVQIGLPSEDINNIVEKYHKIVKRLGTLGNSFVCIISPDFDLKLLADKVNIVDCFDFKIKDLKSEKSLNSLINLPEGKAVMFYMRNPDYKRKGDEVVSQGAARVFKELSELVGEQIYYTRNCKEGKDLFDRLICHKDDKDVQ